MIDVSALRGRRIMIGGPVYQSRLHVRHVASLVESIARLNDAGCAVQLHWVTGCSRITRARNEMLATFMASEADYLLSVDSDVAWDPMAPLRLMAHDLPFVAATTVKRGSKEICIRNLDWDNERFDYDPVSGLLRVGVVGHACVMIRRDMVEAMERAYPNLKIEMGNVEGDAKKHLFAFYHEIVNTGINLEGEDYALACRWRAIGGEVFVDPWVLLTHFGEEEGGGRLADDLERMIGLPQAEAA